jgi:hypothetical protein
MDAAWSQQLPEPLHNTDQPSACQINTHPQLD